MKNIDLQDLALRGLIVAAGVLSAILLALEGQGHAIPALALGATLGTLMMARIGPTEE